MRSTAAAIASLGDVEHDRRHTLEPTLLDLCALCFVEHAGKDAPAQ